MRTLTKLLAMMIVLCMLLGLCACQNSGSLENDAETGYKVTVLDQNSNPIAGVMVQLCLDSCIPGKTNENGVASFTEIEDGAYKVSLMSLPEGYEYATEEHEWNFPDGERALTIVLKHDA